MCAMIPSLMRLNCSDHCLVCAEVCAYLSECVCVGG